MIRHLSVTGPAAIGIALLAAQPARAAAVFICDFSVCGSPDPNITFSANDFEGSFQLNSLTIQSGLNNPTTTLVSENAFPGVNAIDGAAENDFSGTWTLGASIVPENETVFFARARQHGTAWCRPCQARFRAAEAPLTRPAIIVAQRRPRRHRFFPECRQFLQF